MLEIKLCDDKKQIAALCKRCGKLPGEAFYAYIATDRSGQLAQVLFEVTSEHVCVRYYDCKDKDDYWLFDGMLRAGFHYAEEQGIEKGMIPEKFRIMHEALFVKLNYPVPPEFDITNFFRKYKNCNSAL